MASFALPIDKSFVCKQLCITKSKIDMGTWLQSRFYILRPAPNPTLHNGTIPNLQLR